MIFSLRLSYNSCGVSKSYTVDEIHEIAVFTMVLDGYWFDKKRQATKKKKLVNELEISIAVRI